MLYFSRIGHILTTSNDITHQHLTHTAAGPKELAAYLMLVGEDKSRYNRYLAWKHGPLATHFLNKYQRCVFYSSECRLCSK